MVMAFEFDEQKSSGNLQKHGIDFIEAQKLWDDVNMIVIPARTIDESRYLLIAMLGKSTWSAIYTIRDNNIRIISVRKARENEKEIYFGK